MKSLVLASVVVSVIALFQNCGGVAFTQATANSASALPPVNNTIPPLVCSAGNTSGPNINYYPTQCLIPPTNVSNNSMGVEINNAYTLTQKVFSISANDQINGVPSGESLYVEFATYVAPDTIVISAVDKMGNQTELLNVCNVSTYDEADPTNGTTRPYSDTILQFNVNLPAGTVKLQFDYTGSTTPTYVGVWNLDSFSQSLSSSNPFSGSQSSQYRVQSFALSLYNDNKDPNPAHQVCSNI